MINYILYPGVDHDVEQDEDEEGGDLEEDVGDAGNLFLIKIDARNKKFRNKCCKYRI